MAQRTIPRTDVDFWNLDGLSLRDSIQSHGEMQLVAVPGGPGKFKRIGVLYNPVSHKKRVLIFSPDLKVIQEVDSSIGQVRTLYAWSGKDFADGNFIDMCMFNGDMYLLDRRRRLVVRFKEHRDELQLFGEWPIHNFDIGLHSQICVTTDDNNLIAYIGPCSNNKFLSVQLTAAVSSRELRIQLPDNAGSLGKELHFCCDNQSNTLIIADTLNHRIIEAACDSGLAKIIGGTGTPGNSENERDALRVQLNYPRALAIYRPSRFIDKGKLSEQSRTFLGLDPLRVKPRTIFIADSNNFCIKKLVELPQVVAETLGLQQSSILYRFIGSGNKPKGDLPPLTSKHRGNLVRYPILKPFDLCVTESGELFIAFTSSVYLMRLRPATSSADTLMLGIGQSEDIQDT